jgi:hypothetical protein
MELKSVYKANDEFEAISLRELLFKEGIEAVIQSRQVPMYDGVMTVAVGYWGDLLVREEDFEKAKELIEGFLS